MNHRLGLGFTLLLLIGIISVSGCTYQNGNTVPNNITYGHTNRTNCHVNPNYPFQIDEPPITIKGKVKVKRGTKQYPWKAAVVKGKYLFNPETGDLVDNFDKIKGKNVKIKGYSGPGEITMKKPFEPNKTHTINFDNAFYVSKIIDWRNICCDTINWKENISGSSCFWFQNSIK